MNGGQRASLNFYAGTFSIDCWLAFGASFVLLSMGFALISRFATGKVSMESLIFGLQFTFKTFTQPSEDLDHKGTMAFRLLNLSGLCLAFILLNTFNALLISSLANETVDHKVSSLEVHSRMKTCMSKHV